MMNAPELNTKITMSWYLLFGLLALTVLITTDVNKVFSQDDKITTVEQTSADKIEELDARLTLEIKGLRADWERNNENVEADIEEVKEDLDNLKDELKEEIEEASTAANGRMDRKIKNHERAEHK